MKPVINLNVVRAKAEEIILRQAREAIGGPARMDRAVDELAAWVRAEWQPSKAGWLVAKPIVIWLGKVGLRAVLQGVHNELQLAGQV